MQRSLEEHEFVAGLLRFGEWYHENYPLCGIPPEEFRSWAGELAELFGGAYLKGIERDRSGLKSEAERVSSEAERVLSEVERINKEEKALNLRKARLLRKEEGELADRRDDIIRRDIDINNLREQLRLAEQTERQLQHGLVQHQLALAQSQLQQQRLQQELQQLQQLQLQLPPIPQLPSLTPQDPADDLGVDLGFILSVEDVGFDLPPLG